MERMTMEDELKNGAHVYEPSYGHGIVEKIAVVSHSDKAYYAVKFQHWNDDCTRWFHRHELKIVEQN